MIFFPPKIIWPKTTIDDMSKWRFFDQLLYKIDLFTHIRTDFKSDLF